MVKKIILILLFFLLNLTLMCGQIYIGYDKNYVKSVSSRYEWIDKDSVIYGKLDDEWLVYKIDTMNQNTVNAALFTKKYNRLFYLTEYLLKEFNKNYQIYYGLLFNEKYYFIVYER